jgi:hypothetical protein
MAKFLEKIELFILGLRRFKQESFDSFLANYSLQPEQIESSLTRFFPPEINHHLLLCTLEKPVVSNMRVGPSSNHLIR